MKSKLVLKKVYLEEKKQLKVHSRTSIRKRLFLELNTLEFVPRLLQFDPTGVREIERI
jgi:hypothetical protein